ncbi:MAG: UDP-3-O-(3-hydroxymyristoyl)glucosamine N-acyltransferase [Mariprofundaceae bacterium]
MPPEKAIALQDIAELVSGRLEHARAEIRITGVNTLEAASSQEASFLANLRYKAQLNSCRAAVVLLNEDTAIEAPRPVIRVKDSYLAFALLQRYFHPDQTASGFRHPSACIDETATLADDVDVAATAVIGAGVAIGSGTRIGAGCIIGRDVIIGERSTLRAHTVVGEGCVLGNDVSLQSGVVIGSDGFGYAWNGQQHLKIPQVGRVVIEDDVEIGANTCIDRGAIGDTVIEQGARLDNQIQIGHNVKIGAYSILVSQVGVSGSTVIGQGCQIGGQAGVAGHIHIGNGCKLAARTGVISDLEAGGTYAGIPAMPHRDWLKISSLLRKLPEMWKAICSH